MKLFKRTVCVTPAPGGALTVMSPAEVIGLKDLVLRLAMALVVGGTLG